MTTPSKPGTASNPTGDDRPPVQGAWRRDPTVANRRRVPGPAEAHANLELTTLYAVSKILGASLDFQRTAKDVLNVLSSYMNMRRCTISLVQEEGGDLCVVASSGLSREDEKKGRYRPGEGVIGHILKSELPIVIPDVSTEPRFLSRTGSHIHNEGEVVSFIGVPIKAGGRAVGVLAADRLLEPDAYLDFDGDVRLLTMVANLIGQTVSMHQMVAKEREFLMQQQYRKQKSSETYDLDNVVGTSGRMREVFAEVHQVAPTGSTVLLRGESGTGKELVARAIHNLSPRKSGPFIKLNCAALTESLLESELFGHEKGAFTGASATRQGRFEQANGGTLFLDEIGEISPSFQAKLLRVLQEREFERVGGNRTIKVDVRLICATNRNLEEAVGQGRFRADLYYRINVVAIFLPALRERAEDVPALVEHFLAKQNQDAGRNVRFAPRALSALANCCWPGNVRELQNCVEREFAMAKSDVIEESDLACRRNRCFSTVLWQFQQQARQAPGAPPAPGHFPASEPWQGDTGGLEGGHGHHPAQSPTPYPTSVPQQPGPVAPQPMAAPAPMATPTAAPSGAAGGEDMPESSRERLIWAMEKTGWVQAKAARLLGLTPRQIGYALKKHDVPMKKL